MKLTKEELKTIMMDTARQAVREEIKSAGVLTTGDIEIPEGTVTEIVEHKAAKPATPTPNEEIQRKYSSVYIPKPAPAPAAEQKQLPAGIGLARSIKCSYLAGGKDPEYAAQIARKMYDDAGLEREFKAMTATLPADGGLFIPETYVNEIIPLLRAKSVIAALGARTISMPSGNLTIPRQTGTSTAAYVGELRKPSKSQPSYGTLKMSAKKLMGLVEISNDLMRSASLSADALVRDDAIQTMALAQDKAALVGTGTEFTPLGILNSADVQKMAVDAVISKTLVGEMLAKLVTKNVDLNNLGWAINGQVWGALYNFTDAQDRFIFREGLDKGMLNNHKVAISNQLPATGANLSSSIILGDWSQLLIGEQMSMQAQVFDQATVIDANDDVLSAMSRDTVFMRLMAIHDFGIRQPDAFVVATGVKTKA